MQQFYTKDSQSIVGVGLPLPLEATNGKLVSATGYKLVNSGLKMLFSFSEGERFMLGEYFAPLKTLLEEPNDNELSLQLSHILPDVIAKWEPRVSIVNVEIERNPSSPSSRTLKLVLELPNSPSESFTYPLYTNTQY